MRSESRRTWTFALLAGLLAVSVLTVVPPPAAAGDVKPRPLDAMLIYENFETGFPGLWTVGDSDGGSGSDYWDDSTWRAFQGASSGWSAGIGWNDNWGDWNVNVRQYDDDMDAYMYQGVDFSSYNWGRVEYWYWLSTESCCDGLRVMYYDGGWIYVDEHRGSSGGWTFSSVVIPASATGVGLFFFTDGSVINEGAYIDEVEIWGVGMACSASVSSSIGLEATTNLQFTAAASGGTAPYLYAWDFDDTTTSTQQNPTHTYAMAGTYYPTLLVQDSLGTTCTRGLPPITIGHAGPITVSVSPAAFSVDPARTQLLTAEVRDIAGHLVASPAVAWTVSSPTCGTLTSATGATTTFRAADGAAGERCQVTATATFSTWSASGATAVTVTGLPMWMLAVIAIGVLIPLLLVLFLLMRRRQKQQGVMAASASGATQPGQAYPQGPTGGEAYQQWQAPTTPSAAETPSWGATATTPETAAPAATGYAAAQTAPQGAPVCPRCGREIQYVAQYGRWYCPAEGTYL